MLADLIAELPDGTVVTDPDIVASYRQDRAADPERRHRDGRRAAASHRRGPGRHAVGDRTQGARRPPRRGHRIASGNMAFAALKERALRLNLELSGHRFLFGSIAVGGSRLEPTATAAAKLRGQLRELREDAARVWREVHFAASVQARFAAVGILERETAAALGSVGPAARASGVARDTRGESPGLWYGSSFAAALPAAPSGDVAARLAVRAIELEASFAILDELLCEPLKAAAASATGPASAVGVARVESPRGETVCVVEQQRGQLSRLRLRSGSYANWPALAAATAGNLLPDFPLINKSFELCYACVDR